MTHLRTWQEIETFAAIQEFVTSPDTTLGEAIRKMHEACAADEEFYDLWRSNNDQLD